MFLPSSSLPVSQRAVAPRAQRAGRNGMGTDTLCGDRPPASGHLPPPPPPLLPPGRALGTGQNLRLGLEKCFCKRGKAKKGLGAGQSPCIPPCPPLLEANDWRAPSSESQWGSQEGTAASWPCSEQPPQTCPRSGEGWLCSPRRPFDLTQSQPSSLALSQQLSSAGGDVALS